MLDIVIVSYNCRDVLEGCLQSIADAPPDQPYTLTVVDNASSDGTVARLHTRWPAVRLIEAGRNLGFAAANNIAIRATSGSSVLLLNPDTMAPPGAIDRLTAALDACPDAAVAGPRIVDAHGRAELSFGRMIGPLTELRQKLLVVGNDRGLWPFAAIVERLTRRAARPDWVSGACLLIRRDALTEAGLLDERFFMYTEDVDLCASVRRLGRSILFVPDACIVHLRGRSAAGAAQATRTAYRRSQIAFYDKHHPRWVPWLKRYLAFRGEWPRSDR